MRVLFAKSLVLLLVLWPFAGKAAHDGSQPPPTYLNVDLDWALQIVGPPPAQDSTFYKEQMFVVLWLQETRTPEQIAFVEQPLDSYRFAPILADVLLQVNAAELHDVIEEAIIQARVLYDGVKNYYDRPRPFVVTDRVKPVADARPVPSYPSGHATRAAIYAGLFSEVFPCKEKELTELGRQIGYGRVTGGVHFPIDVLAGFELGQEIVEQVKRSPAFQSALEDVGHAESCAGGVSQF